MGNIHPETYHKDLEWVYHIKDSIIELNPDYSSNSPYPIILTSKTDYKKRTRRIEIENNYKIHEIFVEGNVWATSKFIRTLIKEKRCEENTVKLENFLKELEELNTRRHELKEKIMNLRQVLAKD